MKKYIHEDCTICNNKLKENNIISVCPECGAPFHKHCYEKFTFCYFCKENKNEVYKQKNTKNIETLNEKVENKEYICGISEEDLASYIGKNSEYFIRKFKEMSNKKRVISFNWCAFFMTPLYLFYRKLNLHAILILLINSFLTYPLIQIDYKNNLSLHNVNPQLYATILAIFSFIIFLYFGFRFNSIYKNRVIKDINYIKSIAKDNIQYNLLLSIKGRTSIFPIYILLIIVFLRSLIR